MSPIEEYQSEFIELSDQAMVGSFSDNQHFGVVGFSFFRNLAQWRMTGEQGTAVLTENSVAHGGYPIKRWPDYTELTLIPDDINQNKLIRYRINDPKRGAEISVHETVIPPSWTIGMAMFALASRKERKLGLANPSFEQIDTMLSELKRGASGDYRVRKP